MNGPTSEPRGPATMSAMAFLYTSVRSASAIGGMRVGVGMERVSSSGL